MPNKLFSKKKRQINKNKQKINMGKTSLRKAIISSLDNSYKKKLPVLISASKKSDLKAKNINIAMIDMDPYYVTCCLIKA